MPGSKSMWILQIYMHYEKISECILRALSDFHLQKLYQI